MDREIVLIAVIVGALWLIADNFAGKKYVSRFASAVAGDATIPGETALKSFGDWLSKPVF